MFKHSKTVLLFGPILLFLPFLAMGQADSTSHGLDYYLNASVNNSPLLKDYADQLLSNRLDSLVIKAQNEPQVNGNAQALYAPNYGKFGYDAAITNGGNYAAQIVATQNILNSKLLKPQYASVYIQNQSIANTSRLSTHDLKHDVTSQYITAWSDKSQLNNAIMVKKLMDEEEKILKPLVKNGMQKQSSYIAFSIEQQTDEINFDQLRVQYAIDIMTLNILCGLSDTSATVKLQPPTLTRNYLKYNFNDSKYAVQFHIDSLQISNGKAVVDARYKPHFAWDADAGFLSSTPLFYMHPGFSLGLSFVIPVFDGGQRSIEYQRLAIQENSTVNYAAYFRNKYNMQFAVLNHQLNATDVLTEKLKAQLNLSNELIAMNKSELNSGDMSITDFIINLRSQIDIRNNLNSNQAKAWQIINDMNYWNW